MVKLRTHRYFVAVRTVQLAIEATGSDPERIYSSRKVARYARGYAFACTSSAGKALILAHISHRYAIVECYQKRVRVPDIVISWSNTCAVRKWMHSYNFPIIRVLRKCQN